MLIPEDCDEESRSNSKQVLPEMKLTLPTFEEKSTRVTQGDPPSTTTSTKGMSSDAERPQAIVIDDRDLPSSTPAPPPLNVPIVTHLSRPTEGDKVQCEINAS